MCTKSCLRRHYQKQHVKQFQTLLKSSQKHLYHICWSLWKKLSLKKSLLAICKILGPFVNTLTTDEKNSLLNRNNLTQPIQMQLSKKEKSFCQFLSEFIKSITNFKIFDKKDDYGLFIFGNTYCKRCG